MNPSAKWLQTSGDNQQTEVQTPYALTFKHTAFRRRLSSTLTGSVTNKNKTRAWRGKFGATYRLSEQQALKVQVQSNNMRNSEDPGREFDEYTASMTLAHRF